MIIGLLLIAMWLLILAAPIAFFLMLFLGNLGVHLSFWGSIPGALVLQATKTMVQKDGK